MKNILTLLLSLASITAFSQTPEQSLWWNNTSVFNPAFTGFEYKHNATVTGRLNNRGLSSNSADYSALYEVQLSKNKKFKTGIGLNYLLDDLPSIRTDNVRLNIAEHLYFSDKHSISVGIGLGLESSYYSTQWIAVDPNDPAIPDEFTREGKFQWNAGLVYKFHNLTLAAGAANLNEKSLDDVLYYQTSTTYSGQAAYRIKLSENLHLTPRVNMMMASSSTLYQTNLTAQIKEKYLIGLSYSDNSKAALNLGYILTEHIHFNYAFQQIYRDLKDFTGNAHELSVAFRVEK